MKTRIVIPARMAATRLPGKPLVDIAGKPMIVRVCEAARKAQLGEPLIAAGDPEIVDCVTQAGMQCVLTDPELPSGTDRVYAALGQLEESPDIIINLQGDLPDIEPALIRQVAKAMAAAPLADMATLIAPITKLEELTNPDVVKAVVKPWPQDHKDNTGNMYDAVDFKRKIPAAGSQEKVHFQHIGIYGYRRSVLERFIRLAPSTRELKRKLEQMRALDHGMRIVAIAVEQIPVGVDGPDDLAQVQKLFGAKN